MDLNSALASPLPVISNRVLVELLQDERLTIDGFDPGCLSPTAYQIKPGTIRLYNDDEDGLGPDYRRVSLSEAGTFKLLPGDHVSVSPNEIIKLAEGFYADFFPSSWCVEQKLHLTLGRLEAGYEGELVFGVFNAGRYPVTLHADFQLARMSIGWLGTENLPTYSHQPPGTYIPRLKELRSLERELDKKEEELNRQKQAISHAREELEKRKFEHMQE